MVSWKQKLKFHNHFMSTLRSGYLLLQSGNVCVVYWSERSMIGWFGPLSSSNVSNSCRNRISLVPVASQKSIEQWYVFFLIILFPRKRSKSIYGNADRCNWLTTSKSNEIQVQCSKALGFPCFSGKVYIIDLFTTVQLKSETVKQPSDIWHLFAWISAILIDSTTQYNNLGW